MPTRVTCIMEKNHYFHYYNQYFHISFSLDVTVGSWPADKEIVGKVTAFLPYSLSYLLTYLLALLT